MSQGSEPSVSGAEEDDLPGVLSLFWSMLDTNSFYNDIAKRDERAKYTLPYLEAKRLADKYAILVAKERTNVLGFAISRYDDHLIWLEWLVVDPASRRIGVASVLLRALIETAHARRAHKVWCDTRSTNEPAKRTFRKNGFSEIAEVKNHWYGEDYILWEKLV